jgi:peptidoglycan/xylan/chitin deacetylase (PgdA/CDA1 family)
MLTFKNVNKISTLLLFIIISLILNNIIAVIWIFVLVITWFSLTVIGSFHIRWDYFLKAHHKNEKVNDNVISLTFDDGPNEVYTIKVLELLKMYNFKATFFLIGNKIEENSSIVKEIINQGHTIGNHTFSHSNNFGFLKTNEVVNDLKKTNKIIENFHGLKMKLYRPAFGVTNPRISKAVKKLKMTAIGWSVRSLDTTKDSKETIIKRITKNLKKGDVVLLHDTSQKTVEVLEQLLIFLDKKRWKSITVDQLLKIKAYA